MSKAPLLQALADRGVLWRDFAARDRLDQALCDRICDILGEALTQRGEASVVLPGGSTPRGLLSRLAKSELDWSRVRVVLSDERWLPVDHAESNERQLRQLLLQGPAAQARYQSLVPSGLSREEGADDLNRQLSAWPRFDCVVLGMGHDGHIASLFPDSPQRDIGLAGDSGLACVAVETPASPHARISLTLPRLLNSRQLILHIFGEQKRDVLAAALQDQTALPVAALLAVSPTERAVYWAP